MEGGGIYVKTKALYYPYFINVSIVRSQCWCKTRLLVPLVPAENA